jgi:hypothetical protein
MKTICVQNQLYSFAKRVGEIDHRNLTWIHLALKGWDKLEMLNRLLTLYFAPKAYIKLHFLGIGLNGIMLV